MDLAGRASTTDPAPHHPRKSVLERDLTGYGANPPIGPWPHGARIAISFVLNYEEGAELAVPRDDASEGYLWEWAGAGTGATSMVPISSSTSSNPAAARNNFAVKSKKSTDVISKSMPKRNFISEQDYEYGSRVGCWRILRLLAEFGFRASLFLVAEAGEKNRPFVNKCVEAGWEIVCHGVRWIDTSGFNEEMDMLYIGEALRRVEDLIGYPPVGAYFGRVSNRARAMYSDACNTPNSKLLYSSEAYNDDIPYWVDLPWEREGLPEKEHQGLLVVPYNQDCNDANHLISPGFTSSAGDTYYNYLVATFNCLHREGGKIMNIPLHARISGKPGRSEALRKFLEYIKFQDAVWVATREEIARVWKKEFPYRPRRMD